jgi:hypothetical protein
LFERDLIESVADMRRDNDRTTGEPEFHDTCFDRRSWRGFAGP